MRTPRRLPAPHPAPRTAPLARGAVLLVLGAVLLPLLVPALSPATLPTAAAADEARPASPTAPPADRPWDPEVVELFARMPVQDGGRIMPFLTWSGYALLATNHHRLARTPSDRILGPVEWALDAMFRPEVARTYRCFVVDTDEALAGMGLDRATDASGTERKKRDRYSYDELLPGRGRLMRLAQEVVRKKESEREPAEQAIYGLAVAMREFEGLLHLLDYARADLAVPDVPALRQRFGGERASWLDVAEAAPDLVKQVFTSTAHRSPEDLEAALRDDPGVGLVRRAVEAAGASFALRILPPSLEQSRLLQALADRRIGDIHPEEWLTPLDVADRAVSAPGLAAAPEHVAMLRELAAVRAAPDDPAVRRHAEAYHALARKMAEARDEYRKIDLEVFLVRTDPFGVALFVFLGAFLLVAASWLWPNRWLERGAFAATAAGALIVIAGITIRCILRDRPPVVNLYETIPFITAFAVLLALVVESLNRERIALALAPAFGAIGLFVTARYEDISPGDTLRPLVAVLDTNFWLTTHVIAIAIGYSVSLLCGAIGHVQVLGTVFGLKRGDPGFQRTLTRMLYGTLAFGLIFSVIGTILGGIWANESWGRFWGWDPKENGALLIVLWQLALVHLRIGGYIREFGMAMGSVVLAAIVAFSWWGVNLLGIGLHSYGFVSGIWTWLTVFWGIEAAVLLTGGVWWWSRSRRAVSPSTAR